jgi:phosphoglycerol transferase MdoB-like AlkP superfamily enzyme
LTPSAARDSCSSLSRTVRVGLACLGPLAGPAAFFVCALVLLSASRLGLAALHWQRLSGIDGVAWLFPIGVRLDAMTLAPALLPAVLAAMLVPSSLERARRALVAGYLVLVAVVLAFFETATYPFLAEYDSRPNHVLLGYLAFPREIAAMLWSNHRLGLALGLVVPALVARLVWTGVRAVMRREARWGLLRRALSTPLAVALLFLGARATLGPRPANVSTAAFSADHLANELALDSTYAVAYAVYRTRDEIDPRVLYGDMPRAEAIARVRRQMLLPQAVFDDPDVPLLHRETAAAPRERPYNLVIILEESLGAEFVGALGGLPLTPQLDALAEQGVLFTNLYATGTRTARGIEATVSGCLPTPGDAVVRLAGAQRGFFTVAELLRSRGYATDFLYGGMSNFDNMRGFFLGNGFERVLDEPTFERPVFRGTWGVSDEDLFGRANTVFVTHRGRPFFALLLTTSNHDPFEFPPGRVAGARDRGDRRAAAVRYADSALGEFFRRAQAEEYFDHTVFVIVADHDTRVFGADLIPLDKFHIPGVIIAPGQTPRRYAGLASQLDLLPTALGLLGIDTEHPMAGRNLLAVGDGTIGRAVMQYELTHAYRVGDAVVIHQPYQPAREFIVHEGRLVPATLDPELARDALAHVLTPALLYRERRYRLRS